MIYRYCMSLPKDQLSDFKEEWYIPQDENKFHKCILTLPINSVMITIKIEVNILIFL